MQDFFLTQLVEIKTNREAAETDSSKITTQNRLGTLLPIDRQGPYKSLGARVYNSCRGEGVALVYFRPDNYVYTSEGPTRRGISCKKDI